MQPLDPMSGNSMPGDSDRVGVIDQVQRTRGAFMRLLNAHVGLLRAEISEILNQLKVIAGLAGAILGVAFMVGCMLYVGGFLFMGEWLFGSIGWGFAHGVLFGIDLIVVFGLAIVGAPAGRFIGGFLLALVVASASPCCLGSTSAMTRPTGRPASWRRP